MTALEEIKKAVEAEIERVVQSVNEWDDRTSPDDYPEHLLITSEELADLLRNFAAVTLESLNSENERLRQFLFPYADRTDISGISWDGKYLIGDKESIRAFHEMKNRGEQIDTFKNAYEQSASVFRARAEEAVTAANALQVRADTAEAEIKRLEAEIDRKSSMPGDHRYWEGRYREEAAENDRLNVILEPFRAVSKDWVDENGWTDVACQKDRIVDWFGPSDFRALASTGGEHNGN